MASSYSALLRFELIGPGEQSGLWGNTTNSNIGTLIEQAIAGVTFVNLTGLATYTLSTTNGTPDEQRSAALVFTGSPTGAVTVTVPALQKNFIARNASSQSITLKTAAQVGGVSVAAGTSMIVFCDGANIYPAIAGLSLAQGGTGGTDAGTARTALAVPSTSGSGAFGTWSISIAGNAATATSATNALNATNASTLAGVSAANFAQLAATNQWTNLNSFSGGFLCGTTTQPSPTWNAYFRSQSANPATVHFASGASSTGISVINEFGGNAILFSYGSPAPGVFTAVGSIQNTGSSVAYNTTSDYRLKEAIRPLPFAVQTLKQLRPCTFKWKAFPEAPRVMGFIAHEVQAVVPQAVTGEKDAPEMQQLDHSKLVPLLTAALQEAFKRIEMLERQLGVY